MSDDKCKCTSKQEKSKPTLQEKLAKRKYKIPNALTNFIYFVVMDKFVARKYNSTITYKDKISECKGPAFLVWNHLSRFDHYYAMKVCYPRRMNMVAGYVEFFRSHLHFAFKHQHILPKKNFTQDLPGIRAMHSIIKQGGIVCFSPEGMSSIYGCNQPIVPGTGRFIQSFRIPVYFMKMRGQYLTTAKVCLDEHYGHTECEVSLLFSPEDLERMKPEEIDAKLNEVFRGNDYEWGREQHIEWSNPGTLCKHLDDICYRCPTCGAEFQMIAETDFIKCKKCGNGAHMNKFYEFVPLEDDPKAEHFNVPVDPVKWVEQERVQIIDEIRSDANYSFKATGKLGYVPEYHWIPNKQSSEICGEGTMTFDHAGIHYDGTKLGKPWHFDLSYQVIYSLVIETDMRNFGLYIDGEYHEFYTDIPCVGKALLVTEEMHRYHYNTWKNFPWCDWMYEGKALGIDNKKE